MFAQGELIAQAGQVIVPLAQLVINVPNPRVLQKNAEQVVIAHLVRRYAYHVLKAMPVYKVLIIL